MKTITALVFPLIQPASAAFGCAVRHLLSDMQCAAWNTDSKGHVDRPFRLCPTDMEKWAEHVAAHLRIVGPLKISMLKTVRSASLSQILAFHTSVHTRGSGSDIAPHRPWDFDEALSGYEDILASPIGYVFAALNRHWLEMSKISTTHTGHSSTFIKQAHPFFVPGGRFREPYYWDSYWILRGLLRSNMYLSARHLAENTASMIEKFGHVPNGARTYYLNRSQPPLFPHMLLALLNSDTHHNAHFVLGRGLDAAIAEHAWFEQHRSVSVRRGDCVYDLNLYHVSASAPRPEAFCQDSHTTRGLTESEALRVFSNLQTAAESGWDFSTRWLASEEDLRSIWILDLIPADLNAIMFANEKIIARLLRERGDAEAAETYDHRAHRRRAAINALLWNAKTLSWNDYNYVLDVFNDKRFYFSNLAPLVYGMDPPNAISVARVLRRHRRVLFGFPGGVPASGASPVLSKEQWDFPNVWAPHPSMLVDFLLRRGERYLAYHAARSFFESVRSGYDRDGVFYEKYSCLYPGLSGDGGEYVAQTGFGWTNGTALDFIAEFWREFLHPFDHAASYRYIKQYLDSLVADYAL